MIEETNALFRRKLFVESEKIFRFICDEVDEVDDIELLRIFKGSLFDSIIETTFFDDAGGAIEGKIVLV